MAPSKVNAFVWHVMLDRIQMKTNLRKENIINSELECLCSFCHIEEETTSHLLLMCLTSSIIWIICYKWLGFQTSLPAYAVSHWLIE